MLGVSVALLVISAIAAAVVVSFALPNIRGGARVLTPEGYRLAERLGGRLRPVVQMVWPRVRPAIGRVSVLTRRFAGPAVVPLGRRLRPMIDAFLRASFDGVGPTVRPDPSAGRRPPRDRQPSSPTPDRPAPGPDAHLVVDLRDGVQPHATAAAHDSVVSTGHR